MSFSWAVAPENTSFSCFSDWRTYIWWPLSLEPEWGVSLKDSWSLFTFALTPYVFHNPCHHIPSILSSTSSENKHLPAEAGGMRVTWWLAGWGRDPRFHLHCRRPISTWVLDNPRLRPPHILWCIQVSNCSCPSGVCMSAQSLQSCLTLCNPTDRSPPCSSVHGIL